MNETGSPITVIGEIKKRYEDAPRSFGILQPDRLHHMYIISQTGTGKSTLLFNLAPGPRAGKRLLPPPKSDHLRLSWKIYKPKF